MKKITNLRLNLAYGGAWSIVRQRRKVDRNGKGDKLMKGGGKGAEYRKQRQKKKNVHRLGGMDVIYKKGKKELKGGKRRRKLEHIIRGRQRY